MYIILIGGLLVLLFLYVTYKQIEFFVTARSLYKSILSREDHIVRLLMDIRDGTKVFILSDKDAMPESAEEFENEPIEGPTGVCKHCGQEVVLDETEIRRGAFECPTCGKPSSQ